MSTPIFFFLFIPILAIILLSINIVLAPHNPYDEKNSVFECGFHSFLGQNRTEFSVSFFIFALLFLLFDLEILLVYPYVVSSYVNNVFGLIVMLIFFLILTLGFVFELGKNALSIESKQNNNDASLSIMKWVSNAPPKPHVFTIVPLHSMFFGDIFNKVFTVNTLLHVILLTMAVTSKFLCAKIAIAFGSTGIAIAAGCVTSYFMVITLRLCTLNEYPGITHLVTYLLKFVTITCFLYFLHKSYFSVPESILCDIFAYIIAAISIDIYINLGDMKVKAGLFTVDSNSTASPTITNSNNSGSSSSQANNNSESSTSQAHTGNSFSEPVMVNGTTIWVRKDVPDTNPQSTEGKVTHQVSHELCANYTPNTISKDVSSGSYADRLVKDVAGDPDDIDNIKSIWSKYVNGDSVEAAGNLKMFVETTGNMRSKYREVFVSNNYEQVQQDITSLRWEISQRYCLYNEIVKANRFIPTEGRWDSHHITALIEAEKLRDRFTKK